MATFQEGRRNWLEQQSNAFQEQEAIRQNAYENRLNRNSKQRAEAVNKSLPLQRPNQQQPVGVNTVLRTMAGNPTRPQEEQAPQPASTPFKNFFDHYASNPEFKAGMEEYATVIQAERKNLEGVNLPPELLESRVRNIFARYHQAGLRGTNLKNQASNEVMGAMGQVIKDTVQQPSPTSASSMIAGAANQQDNRYNDMINRLGTTPIETEAGVGLNETITGTDSKPNRPDWLDSDVAQGAKNIAKAGWEATKAYTPMAGLTALKNIVTTEKKDGWLLDAAAKTAEETSTPTLNRLLKENTTTAMKEIERAVNPNFSKEMAQEILPDTKVEDEGILMPEKPSDVKGPVYLDKYPQEKKYANAALADGLEYNRQQANINVDQEFLSGVEDLKAKGYTAQQIMDDVRNKRDAAGNPMTDETIATWQKAVDGVYGGKDLTPKARIANPVRDQQIEDVRQSNINNAEGKGNELGNVQDNIGLEAPDEGTRIARNIDLTSSKIANNANIPTNWYESDAFNSGLIRFGLGLLSGQSYAEAFDSAAGVFDTVHGRDKRSAYRDEMLQSGYSVAQVEEWIRDGKSSVLKKEGQWIPATQSGMQGQRNTKTGQFVPFTGQTTAKGANWVAATQDGLKGQRNTSTGEFKPYSSKLQGVAAGGTGSGKTTGGQLKASSMASRSEYGLSDFNKLYQDATKEMDDAFLSDTIVQAAGDYIGQGGEGFLGALGTRTASNVYPKMAEFRKSAMRTLMPLMRDDSGATIGKAEEQKEFMAYIPQPGSTPEQYKRSMDSLMHRIVTTGAKNPNSAYAVLLPYLDTGRVVLVPTDGVNGSGGIRVVNPQDTSKSWSVLEFANMVNSTQ